MSTVARLSRGVFLCAALISLGFVQPAIAQIKPGVTQSAAHTANITGTVTDSNGRAVSGAQVKLTGPSILSTKSDDKGSFNFTSVPWGTYEITISSTLGTATRSIVVNGDINVGIQYQPTALRTIAHVSTAGAGAHINVTPTSVSSVSPSDYAFQGNGTWTQLFAQVPGVAASGYTGGTSNFNIQAIPGTPIAPVVLSLNGALPYETSTTLDGMPLQGTSAFEELDYTGGGADLSMLPLNAFDTADVVRGPGANAPSIVDSVGGSFVLHGPGEVQATHFEFATSNDPYGGIVSNVKAALHLGRLSATFIYGINDSPGPLGTSHNTIPSITDNLLAINGTPVWGATSSFYTPDPPGFPNCECSGTDTLLYCCTFQSTGWTEHTGAAALSYDITPSITASVFYAGGSAVQGVQGGYLPVSFAPQASSPSYTGSLHPSPPGTLTYSLLNDYVGGPAGTTFNTASSLLEEKITAFVGPGVLRLAALQYNTFFQEDGRLTSPDGQYTVWGTANVGSSSPGTTTAYNGTPETLTFLDESVLYHTWSNNRDLLASYAAQIGSSSSIGLSLSKSYYNDPYFFNLYFSGSPIFALNQSAAASETTNETRIHFDTELSDTVSLGLSWYFAQAQFHVPVPSNPTQWTNSNFPYNAPRFGAVWRPNQNVAVRVAVGGGYALPILYNLTGYSLILVGGSYYETIPNLNLKPEETFGFDVGTDIRVQHDTVLSFDVYRTNLYGQFYTTNYVSTLKGAPLYITQSGNIGTSRYEGINLDLRRDVPHGWYWRATLGLTRGYVVSVPPGFYNDPAVPCTNCTNLYVVPGANFNGAYSAIVPYAMASAQLGYRWGPGKYFDLLPTYYGNNNQYYEKAFVELDAHAGYAVTNNVWLLATVKNITGAYDDSIQHIYPSYLIPTIAGAGPTAPSAALGLPYGPRAVIVTLDFRY
jgi:outer membrane receptor protein involved in Fe transport